MKVATSSLLNWPDGVARTPESERVSANRFDTPFRRTKSDLADEMRRMEVDDWRLDDHRGSGGDPGIVIRWIKDGKEYAVAADQYRQKSSNLREAFLWLKETRKSSERDVATARDAFAAAALTDGSERVAGRPAPSEEPYKVLGVPEDSSLEAVEQAYREFVQQDHPDKGGDREEFVRVKKAYESIKGERA